MNLSIYQSFSRIPLGVAIRILSSVILYRPTRAPGRPC